MKKVIVVIIVIFINLLTLQGNVFSKSFYQIPLEPDYWFKKFCGTLEETGNGIKMYGSAYRWGNFMFSKKLYNFSDSEVYVKWLANGDNSYGWFSVSLFGLIGAGFTTDHSWDGSKVILHNEWYYTRIKINSDYTYECVTSTGNYDVNGGNIIDNKSGTLEPNRHEMVYRNQISVSFGDVYAGNSSYMEVEEVKTNAKIIPIENKAKTIYDFENSTNVPSTFTFSGNWIIDNKGFDSSKSLFIETSNTSSITMSVNNAIAISFKFKETNDSIAHGSYKFHFLINGKSMSHAINGDNGSCWNERFYPLYSDRNILEWKVTHPNSVWIDNITIYKSFTDDTPPDNDGNQTDQIISSIPQLINYQGMLTNAEGKPIETDEYKLSFSIFNHPTGGTEVWGPQKFDGSDGNGNKVPVVRGLFNVLLGPKDIHGRLISDAFLSKDAYLEITIEDQMPIAPRQQILSTPYAIRAENGVPIGTVVSFFGDTPPEGWLLCNGQIISNNERYKNLRKLIGDKVPDLRGRVVVGAGQTDGLSNRMIGEKGGEEGHALTIDELPEHEHGVQLGLNTKTGPDPIVQHSDWHGGNWGHSITTSAGGNQAHNNMQPFYVLNYIIKY